MNKEMENSIAAALFLIGISFVLICIGKWYGWFGCLFALGVVLVDISREHFKRH